MRSVVVSTLLALFLSSFAVGETTYRLAVSGLTPYRLSRLEALVTECQYDPTNSVAACVVTESQMREVAKKRYRIGHATIVPGSAIAESGNGDIRLLDSGFTDTDGDGIDDAWETDNFGDLSHDGNGDNDAFGPDSSPGNPVPGPDGVTDLWEYRWGLNPNHCDSDGDNVNDGDEITALRAGDHSHGPPFLGWPTAEQDRDGDCIPDLIEELLLGLNSNRESTDGDKYDDGQEFFGLTEIGRGGMPRAVDSDYLSSSMPNWVDSPGNHWFVAAYPDLKVTLQSDSFSIVRRATIKSGEKHITEQEKTYLCETESVNSSSSMETKSVDFGYSSGTSADDGGEETYTQIIDESEPEEPDPVVALTGDNDTFSEVQMPNTSAKSTVALPVCEAESEDELSSVNLVKESARPVGSGQEADTSRKSWAWAGVLLAVAGVGLAVLAAPVVATGVAATAVVVAGLSLGVATVGVLDAYGVTGQHGGRSRQTGVVATKTTDGYRVKNYIETGPIARNESTEVNDSASMQTSCSSYERVFTRTTSRFFKRDEWWKATASDTHHAADLRFNLKIRNDGTDVCREITRILVNFYIGNDRESIYSVDVLEGHTPFSNVFPEDEINFTSFHDVPLTLDQLKRIDLGEPISLLIERIEYGDDQIFYEDAFAGGVMFKIDDGVADGEEDLDKYLIPTWGVEDYQDVLLRADPVLSFETSESGHIKAVTVPQFDEQHRVASQTRLPVTRNSQWAILTQTEHDEPPPYRDIVAQPESIVRFVHDKDTDYDGYTDRVELRESTDPDDFFSHPAPELLAAYVRTAGAGGTNFIQQMVLENVGNWPAYGIQCQMYSPSTNVHVEENLVGAGGVLQPGQRVIIGPTLETDLTGWNGSSTPAAVGIYEGAADSVFTFAADSSGNIGWTTNLSITWSSDDGGAGSFDVGANYSPPATISITNGLYLRFSSGDADGSPYGFINGGETFSVEGKTARDVFRYSDPGIDQDPLPMAYYKFDNSLVDSWTNGFDLTPREPSGPMGPHYSENGKLGPAYDFELDDGNYVETAVFSGADSLRTIAFWVKPESVSGVMYIIQLLESANDFLLLDYAPSDSGLRFRIGIDGTEHVNLRGGLLTIGQWHHVVAVCGEGGAGLYVNGTLMDSSANETVPTLGMTRLILGNDHDCFDGLMDNVALLRYRYTLTEVRYSHNLGAGRSLPWNVVPTTTRPVVVLSYNDQQGNRKQIVDLELAHLGGLLDFPEIRMRPKNPAPRVNAHSLTQYRYETANPLRISLFNGGATIEGSRLFVEYMTTSGLVVHAESITNDLGRGYAEETVAFDPSAHSDNVATGDEVFVLLTLVDHEGNVIDTASHAFLSGVDEAQHEYGGTLEVSTTSVDLGTVMLGTTPARELVFANTGMELLEFTATSDNPALQTSLAHGSVTLRPAETATVVVWADTRVLGLGSHMLTLDVFSSDADGPSSLGVNAFVEAPPTNTFVVEDVYGHPWRKRIILATNYPTGAEITFEHGLGTNGNAEILPLFIWDSLGQNVGVGSIVSDSYLTGAALETWVSVDTGDLNTVIFQLPRASVEGDSYSVSFGKGIYGPTPYESTSDFECELLFNPENVVGMDIGYSMLGDTMFHYLFKRHDYATLESFKSDWTHTATTNDLLIACNPSDPSRAGYMYFEKVLDDGQTTDYWFNSRTTFMGGHSSASLVFQVEGAHGAHGIDFYLGTDLIYTYRDNQYSDGPGEITFSRTTSSGPCRFMLRAQYGTSFYLREVGFDVSLAERAARLWIPPSSRLSVSPQGDTPLWSLQLPGQGTGLISIPDSLLETAPTNGIGQRTLRLETKLSTDGDLDDWELRHLFLADPTLTYGTGKRPNLSVSSLSTAPQGPNVNLNVCIANMGTTNAQFLAVALYDGNPGEGGSYIGSLFVTNTLEAGTTNCFDFVWTPLEGTDTNNIFAVVDPYNAIDEEDEDDNTGTTAPNIPDVTIASIELLRDIGGGSYADYSHPIEETDVKVRVGASNIGPAIASNVLNQVFDGNPSGGGSLVDSTTVTVRAGSNELVLLDWNPPSAGWYDLTAVADGSNTLAELLETNNELINETLVSIGRRYVDCGDSEDDGYSPGAGFGHLGGVPRIDWGSGAVSTALETARYDLSGTVGYRFDHLDPYYAYQVDLSLYRGESVTSSYEVLLNSQPVDIFLDGEEAVDQIHLDSSNSFMAYGTVYVPSGVITGNTLEASVRRTDGPGPGYLSEIQVAQGYRVYIDCGGYDDLPHNPPGRTYGHAADGYAWNPSGATATTSLRYDFDGDVRYRFSSLDSDTRYVLYVTLWEDDAVGRMQRLLADSSVLCDPVDMSDQQSHTISCLVPSNAVADGEFDLVIERTNGDDVQVSVIELNRWSLGTLSLYDSDNDGMPDSYEVAHSTPKSGAVGLDPHVDDAGMDADGDGMPNVGEMHATTDPQNGDSKLEIVEFAQAATGSVFTVEWSAKKFVHYRIESCADIGEGAWEVEVSSIQALADGPMSWPDPNAAIRPNRFYRVLALPW